MTENNAIPRDEELTAYLDGELSPEEVSRLEAILEVSAPAAERLEFLSRSSLPFKAAFEPLLAEAPTEKLEAMLGALPHEEITPAKTGIGRRGLLGAMAACLVAGIVVDRIAIGWPGEREAADESAEWRAVVAEYIALYTPDTLAGPAPTAAERAAQLARIDERLGLSLSPDAIALPGMDFKRAQILQYDDQPLAQIAYLDPETGPLALCIIRSEVGRKAPEVEGRKGMNVVYWASDRHAFMLIGRVAADRMQAIADAMRERAAIG
ncbi:anti-sigma factor [Rhizobium sp. S152]|uniref:anti-sigma factor family protein n=1 Tax=Rhizobium sp. S152 TaxID=3055038 RepID=UPI0025AA197A|nr:anti-sigma factor [Rhizobium sp. S152]MDM9626475.1 anti-sigma factor [Rhizobium sp. S152]